MSKRCNNLSRVEGVACCSKMTYRVSFFNAFVLLFLFLDFYFKCCGGHVVRRIGGSHAQCCGLQTYDSRFFFCYNRLIYAFCGKSKYNPTTHQCCAGKINLRVGGHYSTCCSTKSYDSGKYFCHDKKVYGKCQKSPYNPSSFICCQDKIRPRDGGQLSKCCKDRSYDGGK